MKFYCLKNYKNGIYLQKNEMIHSEDMISSEEKKK
jgi:hypothetical protein